jgi:hypothetical protein
MYKAVKDNRVEFVDLFLDNGFSMKGFLTDRILLKLYNEDISDSLLSRLLIQQKLKLEKDLSSPKDIKCYTYKNIGMVVEYLIDDFYAHKFCKAPYRKIGRNTSEKILSQTDQYGKIVEETLGIFTHQGKQLNIDFIDSNISK